MVVVIWEPLTRRTPTMAPNSSKQIPDLEPRPGAGSQEFIALCIASGVCLGRLLARVLMMPIRPSDF